MTFAILAFGVTRRQGMSDWFQVLIWPENQLPCLLNLPVLCHGASKCGSRTGGNEMGKQEMTEIPSLTCCSISNEPEQRLESCFQGPIQGLPSAGRCRTASHRKTLKSSWNHWRGRDHRRVPKLKVRYGKSKGSEWFEKSRKMVSSPPQDK